MTEDLEYCDTIYRRFVERRAHSLLMSVRDCEQILTWRERDIPLGVVLRVIDRHVEHADGQGRPLLLEVAEGAADPAVVEAARGKAAEAAGDAQGGMAELLRTKLYQIGLRRALSLPSVRLFGQQQPEPSAP